MNWFKNMLHAPGTSRRSSMQEAPEKTRTPNPLKGFHPGRRFSDTPKHAHFEPRDPEKKLDRKRILTMKYSAQQMSLIKKRIAVENWLITRLETLIGDADKAGEVELDVDELLDCEDEKERTNYIKEKLNGSGASASDINAFIDELVGKLATL